jgi:hypothetical protein
VQRQALHPLSELVAHHRLHLVDQTLFNRQLAGVDRLLDRLDAALLRRLDRLAGAPHHQRQEDLPIQDDDRRRPQRIVHP